MDVHHFEWRKWIPFLGNKEKADNKLQQKEDEVRKTLEKDPTMK